MNRSTKHTITNKITSPYHRIDRKKLVSTAGIVQFKLNLVELFGVRNFNRRSSVFYDSRKKGGEESEGKAEEIACFSNGHTVQPVRRQLSGKSHAAFFNLCHRNFRNTLT
jgi:hypothetical protein